jgi:hypothetical protein
MIYAIKMAFPPPLFTPLISQVSSSQKLPSPNNTKRHLANKQRLIIIKLERNYYIFGFFKIKLELFNP